MRESPKSVGRKTLYFGMLFGLVFGMVTLLAMPRHVGATHIAAHSTACDEADVVGGGASGNSPGPVGPPDVLGWDVDSGQCNGSFTVTRSLDFPSDTGGGIELGLRIEQRGVGQVTRTGKNDYQVELGPDPTAANRAWWNFQHSIACDCDIDALDALTFTITTHVGPNLPAAPAADMLALRSIIDDRHAGPGGAGDPNPTPVYSDLYQTSQNPEFSWFVPTSDTDANSNGKFNTAEEGAWLLTLTAEKDGHSASVSVCVHTPNASCLPPDHYACYKVKERSKLPKGLEVTLSDQLTTESGVEIKKAKEICVPTDKNGEGIFNGAFHLVCYDVKSKEKSDVSLEVMNQFTGEGTQTLRVDREKVHRLCVPSLKPVVEPRD